MQTLGISHSTPRTENRVKSLFWPEVQTGSDVDYLGTQGYWICAIVGVWYLVSNVLLGMPIVGSALLLFYYLGGVGVREHSRFAATVVFVMGALDTAMMPSALKICIAAVLLSNLRATWIASTWKPESADAAMPMRLGETWGDKFADKLPQWLWPKVRIVYYIFSVGFLTLVVVGLAVLLSRHANPHLR